jgi:hypothetical protein
VSALNRLDGRLGGVLNEFGRNNGVVAKLDLGLANLGAGGTGRVGLSPISSGRGAGGGGGGQGITPFSGRSDRTVPELQAIKNVLQVGLAQLVTLQTQAMKSKDSTTRASR